MIASGPMSAREPVERDRVRTHGEVPTERGDRAESARDRRAEQYLQGIEPTRRHNHRGARKTTVRP